MAPWTKAQYTPLVLLFSTVANPMSGESEELIQLAEVSGGKLVHDVPSEGTLVYILNTNIRSGVEDIEALEARRGFTAFLLGVFGGASEIEKWRPHFERLRECADIFFVRHPGMIPCLESYGIHSVYVPANETRYRGHAKPAPNTVLYTGFYWGEKDLPMILRVALLLPEWNFTIQVGMGAKATGAALPGNVSFEGRFLQNREYRHYLPKFEYIWIPRSESPWIYAGRSGITAVASGRPAILTDVGPNKIVPEDAAVKYPADWCAERIADLIRSKPLPDPDAVAAFLDSVAPDRVWGEMKRAMLAAGAEIL